MARKDSDSEQQDQELQRQREREQQQRERAASNTTQQQGENQQGQQSEQDQQGPTHGMVFTAEGGTTTNQDFSDSQMVQNGEWRPETHGEPPDVKPKRNY